jgi:hypothetical protein
MEARARLAVMLESDHEPAEISHENSRSNRAVTMPAAQFTLRFPFRIVFRTQTNESEGRFFLR